MNDWGLPDWRDPSAYGDTNKWEFMRWRWEFYRRRDDLRAAFNARAQDRYKACVANYGVAHTLKPDEPGFTAQAYTTDGFGYASIPNPRISDQPGSIIFSVLDYPGGYARFTAGTERPVDVDGNSCGHILEEREAGAIFDLTKPLAEQISLAKDFLERAQIEIQGRKIRKRRHPIKWLGYLRTLDAREAGASWAEIAALHPNTAQTEQTARDIWEAADALRFQF